jgi:hypothetical protein
VKGAAMYKIRRVEYDEIELDQDELMTIAQAAQELGVSMNTVQANLDANRFTEIIDSDKTWQSRRLLLKTEVEAWKEKKKK